MKTRTEKCQAPGLAPEAGERLIACPYDDDVHYYLRSCVGIFRQPSSLRKWCLICRAPEQALEEETPKP